MTVAVAETPSKSELRGSFGSLSSRGTLWWFPRRFSVAKRRRLRVRRAGSGFRGEQSYLRPGARKPKLKVSGRPRPKARTRTKTRTSARPKARSITSAAPRRSRPRSITSAAPKRRISSGFVPRPSEKSRSGLKAKRTARRADAGPAQRQVAYLRGRGGSQPSASSRNSASYLRGRGGSQLR